MERLVKRENRKKKKKTCIPSEDGTGRPELSQKGGNPEVYKTKMIHRDIYFIPRLTFHKNPNMD